MPLELVCDGQLINCGHLAPPLRPIQHFACNSTDIGANLCCVPNRGDILERARKLAMEIAQSSDIRMSAPKIRTRPIEAGTRL